MKSKLALTSSKSSVPSVVVAGALCVAAGMGTQAQDLSNYPDWSGQWKTAGTLAPQWDPSKGPGLEQQAPLTPEYQTRFEANLADQAAGGQATTDSVIASR